MEMNAAVSALAIQMEQFALADFADRLKPDGDGSEMDDA
jgi:hypothetical protein